MSLIKRISWADVASSVQSTNTQFKLNPRATIFKPQRLINGIPMFLVNRDPNIQVSDSLKIDDDHTLLLYHYKNCDVKCDEFTKEQRGVIYESKTNNLVCKTFGYIDEHTPSTSIEVLCSHFHPLTQYKVFISIEGFQIRLFEYQGIWFISTHHKINAFDSKWTSSTSFGNQFISALDLVLPPVEEADAPSDIKIHGLMSSKPRIRYFLSRLNKNYIYDFLVGNDSDNRLVCNAPKQPVIQLLGVFDRLNNFRLVADVDLPVKSPTELHYDSISDILDIVNRMDFTETQGVMMLHTDKAKLSKIFNNGYFHYMHVRGNTPSIELRYLEVRHDADQKEDLARIFSEYTERFEELERIINEELPETILHIYGVRYIKHIYYHTNKILHFILKNLHSIGSNTIPKFIIMKELNALSPSALLKLIKSIGKHEFE